MPKKKIGFEDAIERLSAIVAAMESDGGEAVSLADSVKLYKEGVDLFVVCREELNKAETAVMELNRKISGEIEVRRFDEVNYDE